VNLRILIFAIYTIFFESLVLGGFGYLVFFKGHSGWWMLFALYLSASQLKPRHFGINYDKSNKKDDV